MADAKRQADALAALTALVESRAQMDLRSEWEGIKDGKCVEGVELGDGAGVDVLVLTSEGLFVEEYDPAPIPCELIPIPPRQYPGIVRDFRLSAQQLTALRERLTRK